MSSSWSNVIGRYRSLLRRLLRIEGDDFPVCHSRWVVRFTWLIAKCITWWPNRLIRSTVTGRDHLRQLPANRPVVFAIVGHESNYDGFYFASLLAWWSRLIPPSIPAYDTVYGDFPPWLCALLGCVPVANPKAAKPRVNQRQFVQRIRAGWPIALFLDGGWNERDGDSVATSVIGMATSRGAVIVPVRLWIDEINPVSRWPRFLRRPRATLAIQPPFIPSTARPSRAEVAAWFTWTFKQTPTVVEVTGTEAGA